jgi:transposase
MQRAKTTLKKTVCGACGLAHRSFYDRKTRRVRDKPCGDSRIYLELEIRLVFCKSCQLVKQEKLAFLANNPFYFRRFNYYVGKRCASSAIQDVANPSSTEMGLNHPLGTQKTPDKC